MLQSQVDANRVYSAGKHVPDKSRHGHPEMDRLNRQGGHPTSNAESGLVFLNEVIRSRWAFYTTGWDLKDRDVYLYNAAHQPTETINYLRDHVAETWNSFDRYEYHYDGNGNLHEYILYGRNNAADDWEYDYKYVYYWSEHNIRTPVRENRALTCLIYPNPAGNVLFIEGLQEPAQAAIYSAQGQLLRTFRVTGTPTDISNLPAGAYFIQFTCGSKTFTRRFLKD